MNPIFDGFWLPKKIKREFVTPQTRWITHYYKAGRRTTASEPGAIGARWPKLSPSQWDRLLTLLHKTRTQPPPDHFERLQKAFETLSQRFKDPSDALTQEALGSIPTYTGYASEMILFVLGAMDLIPLATLSEIVDIALDGEVQRRFVPFQDRPSLKGMVRFYPEKFREPFKGFFSRIKGIFPTTPRHPNQVLGYAAGNVIGTSHLISLLAQVSALIGESQQQAGNRFPAILVKNSRQEPIFAPMIFSTLEEIDPQLTATIALMIWDYEDQELQERLVSGSDLVIAAAADITIKQIEEVIQRVQTRSHPIRFHKHGHKVSFTTIGKAYLNKEERVPEVAGMEILHLTSLLAAVDSIFWDQYGCLSSRIHFVETGGPDTHTPREYGQALVEMIKLLSIFLPRGAIPLHNLHNRFEKYAAMAASGQVNLCSSYDDDFLVVVDSRPWSQVSFQDVVNDCVERTIVVRPVGDLLEIPRKYLGWLPAKNLQTMSVAIDGPQYSSWSSNFTRFVDEIGAQGVTGIRAIGRGAFPQLAYSWDGYLPLDLSLERLPGYFSSVEFENTYQEILAVYRVYASRDPSGLHLQTRKMD